MDADGPPVGLGGNAAVVDDGDVAVPVVGAQAGRIRIPIAPGEDIAAGIVGYADVAVIAVAHAQAESVVGFVIGSAGDQAVVDRGDAVLGIQHRAGGGAVVGDQGVTLVGDDPAVVGEVDGTVRGLGVQRRHRAGVVPSGFRNQVAVIDEGEIVDIPGIHRHFGVDGDIGVQFDDGRIGRVDHRKLVPGVQGVVEIAGADDLVDHLDAGAGLGRGRGGGRRQTEEQCATQRFYRRIDLVGALQAVTGFGLACHVNIS